MIARRLPILGPIFGPILGLVLALVTGAGVFYLATDGLRAVTAEGARRLAVAETPKPVPQFTLETMDGRHVSLSASDGTPVLVEFIYTRCPVICQTAGGNFARLRDRLETAGVSVRMLSVSFDPLHDDLAALSNYGAAHGVAHGADSAIWTVARPDPDDLDRLLAFFGVTVIPDQWGGYQHNAAIHVIDREGRLARIMDIDAIDRVAAVMESGI